MCELVFVVRKHIIGNGSQIILTSASDMTVNQAVLAKKNDVT